jgi:hypothetical protein
LNRLLSTTRSACNRKSRPSHLVHG